jgi:hypothetical protein
MGCQNLLRQGLRDASSICGQELPEMGSSVHPRGKRAAWELLLDSNETWTLFV